MILGTTDSTASEDTEETVPPPLPIKHRESDYCNLPDTEHRTSFLYSGRVSFRRPSKPLPPEPGEEKVVNIPPIPPPKPPKNRNTTIIIDNTDNVDKNEQN